LAHPDTTPPLIELVAPHSNIQLIEPVDRIRFTVHDGESMVDQDSIRIRIDDGAQQEANYNHREGYYELKLLPALSSGTHSVEITAKNEAQLPTTKNFLIILGDSLDVSLQIKAAGANLAGAQLLLDGQTYVSDGNGIVQLEIGPGEYSYRLEKDGYLPISGKLQIDANNLNFDFDLIPAVNMEFIFEDAGKRLIDNVKLELIQNEKTIITELSNAQGKIAKLIPAGTYTYRVSKTGYLSQEIEEFDLTVDRSVGLVLAVDTNVTYALEVKVIDQLGKMLKASDGLVIKMTEEGKEEAIVVLGDDGSYINHQAANGLYIFKISVDGYHDETIEILIAGTQMSKTVSMQAQGYALDFEEEKISIDSGYTVTRKSVDETTEELATGGTIVPGETLYIKENTSGTELPIKVPARPVRPENITYQQIAEGQLEFTMTELDKYEFSSDGESWQAEPTFSDLPTFQKFNLYVRYKAVQEKFASITEEVEVLLKPSELYLYNLTFSNRKEAKFTLGNNSGVKFPGGTLVAAVYDENGRMLEMKTLASGSLDDQRESEKIIPLNYEGARVKVFLLDSIVNVHPETVNVSYKIA
jgi:hypothetical protein